MTSREDRIWVLGMLGRQRIRSWSGVLGLGLGQAGSVRWAECAPLLGTERPQFSPKQFACTNPWAPHTS